MTQHACQDKEKKCPYCKQIVDLDHRCFIQQIPSQEDSSAPPYYIFYDFECTQDTGEHKPNLCIAHRVCPECPTDDWCEQCKAMEDHRMTFRGPTTLTDFMTWLFETTVYDEIHQREKVLHDGAIAIAHNFKGYDGQFILHHLVHHACQKPQVIMNGSKIMSMTAGNIRFKDSCNFMAFPLAALPKAFGLTELKKGYFPHFFNTEANADYIGVYPPAMYYNPDGMKPEVRRDFEQWYQEQVRKGEIFHLQAELEEYCESDVTILRQACMHFQSMCLKLADVDPFAESITFASTGNIAFRRNHMKKDTIAIIPPRGYPSPRQYSASALRWLSWKEHQMGQTIKHARHGGEVQVGSYHVDGYHEASQTVYEFHGCFWHGCPVCFPNLQQQAHPFHPSLTYEQVYQRTIEREQFLRQHHQVETLWEHDYRQKYKTDPEFQHFIDTTYEDFPDPLIPKDALFGGRTNATRLLCEEGDIRYVDVCSLYPFVLKHGTFPIGHPDVITHDFKSIDQYFGLVQCRVIPPRQLFHPVLPYRFAGGKLLFPLCRTCAQQGIEQELDINYRCPHTNQERSLLGTWTTCELNKAIEKGYVLDRIFEVWHFSEQSNTLFQSYIDQFLKIKQQASGFPASCQTPEDRRQYLKEIETREHLVIQEEDVEKNPILRTIAKLFLNCLWGKFAQRTNLPQTQYVKSYEELQQLLQDDTRDVLHLELILNEDGHEEQDMMLVNSKPKDDFEEANGFSNVVLAAFTTSLARLHLYDTLERLGPRVLYFDTDSIIYQHDPQQWNPDIINSLGGWTDELDGDSIVSFVSGGPKNYAYKTRQDKTVCKVKGITLDSRTTSTVNVDTLKQLLRGQQKKVLVSYPHKIMRTKQHKVKTQAMTKEVRVVYDKRHRIENYCTLPYGY